MLAKRRVKLSIREGADIPRRLRAAFRRASWNGTNRAASLAIQTPPRRSRLAILAQNAEKARRR
jgi:hypothetical protein